MKPDPFREGLRELVQRNDLTMKRAFIAFGRNRQLDYAFASRGFHERVRVHALSGVHEWRSSDHYRLLIEVAAK